MKWICDDCGETDAEYPTLVEFNSTYCNKCASKAYLGIVDILIAAVVLGLLYATGMASDTSLSCIPSYVCLIAILAILLRFTIGTLRAITAASRVKGD